MTDDDSIQPYGVELTDGDLAELRETGELRYSYVMDDGDRVEVVLYYDGEDDDGGDGGSGYRVTTTLR